MDLREPSEMIISLTIRYKFEYVRVFSESYGDILMLPPTNFHKRESVETLQIPALLLRFLSGTGMYALQCTLR